VSVRTISVVAVDEAGGRISVAVDVAVGAMGVSLAQAVASKATAGNAHSHEWIAGFPMGVFYYGGESIEWIRYLSGDWITKGAKGRERHERTLRIEGFFVPFVSFRAFRDPIAFFLQIQ
jgi:hypothetical protein